MGIHSTEGRDAGLRRTSRLTRWVALGSAGLTGLLAVVIAANKPVATSTAAAAPKTPAAVTTVPRQDDGSVYGDDDSGGSAAQAAPGYSVQQVQPVQPAPSSGIHVRSGGS